MIVASHFRLSRRFRAPALCAVALAVVFAGLVQYPLVLQRMDTAYPYAGVPMLGPDAEVYYAARVREIYDGFPTLGNTFYSTPKDNPFLQPPLPELSIATAGKLFGLDALDAFLTSRIVLSFTVFLLFTAFLFSVTSRPWVSVLSAACMLFGGALLAAPWDLPKYLQPGANAFEFLRFARAVNPQWSVTWFMAALLGVSVWLRAGKRWPLAAAVAASAVTVYSYVYAWTYLFAALGLLTLWFVVRREWRRVAELIAYWACTFVLSLPYALHLLSTSKHPWYAESAQRLGLIARHGPLILGVWAFLFIGVALLTRKRWPQTWPLLPCLGVAGVVAINQHVITGQFIVPHHYHWYFIQPLASVVAVAYALSFVPGVVRNERLRAVLAVALVAAVVACAAVQQTGAYRGVRDVWGKLQSAAPVLGYVRDHFHPGDAVYSQDVDILNVVPVVSGADVYFAGNADLALAPVERSRNVYFFDLWLQGVTPEQVKAEFPTTRRFMLSSRLHAIYYREYLGDYTKIPDAEVEQNIQLYAAYYAKPLRDKLTLYPLNVVVTTPRDIAGPGWKSLLSCSKEIFGENGYAVRELHLDLPSCAAQAS